MAQEEKSGPEESRKNEDFENTPSGLDDKTHAEIRMLYEESTETLRFAKNHQWKTVGATLLTYLGIVFIAGFVKADADLINKLMAITILLACSVIFTLIIYQFWMHNENSKIDRIDDHLSSLFSDIRAVKSTLEGNIHRYTLLLFMMIVVALGAVVVHLVLDQIAIT